ncbi:MAG: CoA-acylating methylmalonate-semialdehyde dehydrogenase [Steroidobacteraceae bacterium]
MNDAIQSKAAAALKDIPHFMQGTRSAGKSGRALDVFNPATGVVTGRVPLATRAEVDAVVDGAAAAFPSWAGTPAHVRARVLFKFRELVEAQIESLAALITAEHGKILSDSKGELARGLEVVEFACAIPQILRGEYSENVGRGIDSVAIRQPLGVVAGITPFNFPAMVPMWMFPVALACGNTFICKPSERDPSLVVELAALLKAAGLPDGVFNVVHGDKEAVDALLDNPQVRAVSFVGSTPVAQYVYARGTAAGKRVQALGGAKNHVIVMPDADLEQAVNGLVGAAYGAAGERCMAVSIAVSVGKGTGEELVERLKARALTLKVGPGTDAGSEMGPLITKAHRDKVASYIDRGVEEGAELVVDGRRLELQQFKDGFWLGPTLFDRVERHMSIYRNEIFGPVLGIVRAETFNEALTLVNENEFGNGAALFTRDGDTARTFLHEVQAGMVGINVPIPVPMAFHSFGGWKHSMFGDHHMHGMEGTRFYTRLKIGTMRWHANMRAGAQFDISAPK